MSFLSYLHSLQLDVTDFSLFGGAESFSDRKRSPRRTFLPHGDTDSESYPGPPQVPTDFLWLMTEEPHRTRRMAILKTHPEVRVLVLLRPASILCIELSCPPLQVTKLMGCEPLTKYVVLLVVSVQLAVAIALRHTKPLSPLFLLSAYFIGGTANHNLFLAIHEITHNLAFKSLTPNKLLAIFANLPIGIPYSAAFKVTTNTLAFPSFQEHSIRFIQGYHIEHHKFLGQDGIDTDLPSRLELLCLNNVFGKVFFA